MEQAHITNGDYVRVVDWKVDRRHMSELQF